jgi:hypothetical protein
MKIIRVERLIDAAGFSQTETWKTIEKHIMEAIEAIEWPPGSGSFTLYDQPGKARGEGSGSETNQRCLYGPFEVSRLDPRSIS